MKAIAIQEEKVAVNIRSDVHAALKLYMQKHGLATFNDVVVDMLQKTEPGLLEASGRVQELIREATGKTGSKPALTIGEMMSMGAAKDTFDSDED